MPQRKRASLKWKFSQMPVSYSILAQNRMYDARNVCTIQNLLQTRPGTSRYNATAISANEILSLSFFKDNSDSNHVLSKSGASVLSVPTTGVSTVLKTGLNSSTKHRAVTWNGRHFMAIESDGLYQYDGTTFTQLGQTPPGAVTAAKDEGTGTLSNSTYQVAVTFYDSSNGFETNIGTASSNVTTDGGNDAIAVSDIPSSAANANIDKIRIYLKDVTAAGEWLFVDEISLGTTTYSIDSDPTSTSNPPTKNAAPLSGGAKYLAMFGDKLVYSGNTTYPSDVFFSEAYIPDAFDDTSSRLVLTGSGNGPITGIAVGFFNDSNLAPYLCIFKRNSVEVYSEVSGSGVQSIVSPSVGAPSYDSIRVINGDVYFMSLQGWHVISNGKLIKKDRMPYNLGDGDIDNIFNDSGFVYELNKARADEFFSVYYTTLDQYITFVKEAGSSDAKKSYNYELKIKGFRPYSFPLNIIHAIEAEDESTGEPIILFATEGGYILKHSVKESRSDTLADNTTQAIETFGGFYWISGDDMDASYNFGTFIARALRNTNMIQFRYFLNYEYDDPTFQDFDFSNNATGFILDVSKLDEGILSDNRNVQRYVGGIYKTAQSLLIHFYHNVEDSNINLIQGQLDFSKNGAPN